MFGTFADENLRHHSSLGGGANDHIIPQHTKHQSTLIQSSKLSTTPPLKKYHQGHLTETSSITRPRRAFGADITNRSVNESKDINDIPNTIKSIPTYSGNEVHIKNSVHHHDENVEFSFPPKQSTSSSSSSSSSWSCVFDEEPPSIRSLLGPRTELGAANTCLFANTSLNQEVQLYHPLHSTSSDNEDTLDYALATSVSSQSPQHLNSNGFDLQLDAIELDDICLVSEL